MYENRADLVSGSELVSIDIHGKTDFGGKGVVQMMFLHHKGGFHGEKLLPPHGKEGELSILSCKLTALYESHTITFQYTS